MSEADKRLADLLENLAVVRLDREDVLVVRSEQQVSDAMKDSVHHVLRKLFPRNRSIVFDDGLELGVMRPVEEDEVLSPPVDIIVNGRPCAAHGEYIGFVGVLVHAFGSKIGSKYGDSTSDYKVTYQDGETARPVLPGDSLILVDSMVFNAVKTTGD